MKTPRLGCERPAGEHDKLELVIYKRGFESLRFSLMMKGIG